MKILPDRRKRVCIADNSAFNTTRPVAIKRGEEYLTENDCSSGARIYVYIGQEWYKAPRASLEQGYYP